MRKLALLGLLIALASGCGRGWLPIFRGAPCHSAGCGLTAPAQPAGYDSGCVGCGATAGYGSYGDEVGGYSSAVTGDGYYGGIVSEGTVVGPSMTPLAQPAN